MAASKLLFINQPNNATQGYSITGTTTNIPGDVAYIPTPSPLLVGVYDANNVLQTGDSSVVTMAFGTNPTTNSVLNGTLTQQAVRGIATFPDLAVSLGGVGYTLTATDGGLTSATTNAFNITNVYRINPERISGTPTSTALLASIGPYRFRSGRGVSGVRIGAVSTNTTDAISVFLAEPGSNLLANNAMVPKANNYVAATTVPTYIELGPSNLGGDVDIYVRATTMTGTLVITIERIESATAP